MWLTFFWVYTTNTKIMYLQQWNLLQTIRGWILSWTIKMGVVWHPFSYVSYDLMVSNKDSTNSSIIFPLFFFWFCYNIFFVCYSFTFRDLFFVKVLLFPIQFQKEYKMKPINIMTCLNSLLKEFFLEKKYTYIKKNLMYIWGKKVKTLWV